MLCDSCAIQLLDALNENQVYTVPHQQNLMNILIEKYNTIHSFGITHDDCELCDDPAVLDLCRNLCIKHHYESVIEYFEYLYNENYDKIMNGELFDGPLQLLKLHSTYSEVTKIKSKKVPYENINTPSCSLCQCENSDLVLKDKYKGIIRDVLDGIDNCLFYQVGHRVIN